MRYENPHYMAEDAGAADLIADGRLQLGISRGFSEQVIDGWRHFGYRPLHDEDDAQMGWRRYSELAGPPIEASGNILKTWIHQTDSSAQSKAFVQVVSP
jgi:hypothetical protein